MALEQEALELCHLVEKIPAGEDQTNASVAASKLLQKLSQLAREEELRDLQSRAASRAPQDIS